MSAKFLGGLRWYLEVLMGGLLLQGLGSLLFRLVPWLAARAPYLVRGILGIDFWHAWIHIAWGGLGALILARRRDRPALVWLALAFGAFYSALGVAGVAFYHPLGLELGSFENGFHLVAGPATLLLGLLGASLPLGSRARATSP